MELQQQLISLRDTVTQLETTLSIVRPIYDRLNGLETQQADLETAEAFKKRAAAERKRQVKESAPVQQQQEKGLKKGTRFIRTTDDF